MKNKHQLASVYTSIFVAALILAGCQREKEVMVDVPNLKPAALKIPSTFGGPGLDGKTISLSDYKGKVVLLDFWATDCTPCVAQLPDVIAAYEKYHAQGFEVIGISMDDDMKRLKNYLSKHDMKWPQITDPTGKLTNTYVPDGHGIPLTVLFGRDGQMIDADMSKTELDEQIRLALAK